MVLCAKILAMTGCPVMPATNSALVNLSSLFLKTVALTHHPFVVLIWFFVFGILTGLLSGTSRPSRWPCRPCQSRRLQEDVDKSPTGGGKMFTDLDEERHHVEELVNADGAVAVLVEEIEDAEQVVLGLAVAEQVEQHAHAVER